MYACSYKILSATNRNLFVTILTFEQSLFILVYGEPSQNVEYDILVVISFGKHIGV